MTDGTPGLLPWTSHNTIVLLLAGLVSAACAIWWNSQDQRVVRARRWVHSSGLRTDAVLGAAVLASWLAIFALYHFPVSGDVTRFFIRWTLAGKVPGVDFPTLYMPGFCLLMGLLDRCGAGVYTIPAFFAACYGGALLILRRIADRGATDVIVARSRVVAGGLSGGALILAIGFQQDEAWMLGLLLLASLLVVSGRNVSAGITLGLGFVFTKPLFAIPAAAIAWSSLRRDRVLFGVLVSASPILTALGTLGFNPCRTIASYDAYPVTLPSLTALVLTLSGLASHPMRWCSDLAIVVAAAARRPQQGDQRVPRALLPVISLKPQAPHDLDRRQLGFGLEQRRHRVPERLDLRRPAKPRRMNEQDLR